MLIISFSAGDWALVGATAALLASSDHTVASNYQGSVVTNTTDFSLDNSLTSQISRLVDSNDWEGVLAAVAMLDGASDSESTTLEQLSPSELQEKADLQALIVELVAEVVPDEMGKTFTSRSFYQAYDFSKGLLQLFVHNRSSRGDVYAISQQRKRACRNIAHDARKKCRAEKTREG